MDGDVKHLDDVVVDPDTAVAASHRVFNNPLDITFTFLFSIIFWTLMFGIIFSLLHFFFHFQSIHLHVDVQLVGDAVNHVDADDADSKTWWRSQPGFHHEVNVDLGEET